MPAPLARHPTQLPRPLAVGAKLLISLPTDVHRDWHRRTTVPQFVETLPAFHPRAWLDELPPRDAFGTLIFQVVGQQLSVRATRTIVARLQERFGGRMPSPQELLAVDPQELRASGMSTRKGATLRALAEPFVDGEPPLRRRPML